MRKFFQLCLMLFCLASLPVQQVSAAILPIEPTQQVVETMKTEEGRAIAKELRQNRKAVRKAMKQQRPQGNNDQVLCAVIAIFIPFLGVGLWSGINADFWITLILTLLFFIPGLIYGLYVILAK